MIRYVLSLFSLICLLLLGCKTYEASELPTTQLQFGNGGGFTGMTTEYTLLENGQLFIRIGRAGSGDLKPFGKIKKSIAKELFQTWSANDLFKEKIQQPGNRYYYICMQKDSVEYRQSWGAKGYQVDESLKTFFDQAMNLTTLATPEPETKSETKE